MNVRIAALIIACAPVVLLLAACGDGPDQPATTVAPGGTAAPAGSATIAPFGPAPTLGGNVTDISPGHAERVTQPSTRTVDAYKPSGVCFGASFKNAPEQAQWFRMAVDDQEVTTKLIWFVPTQNAPETGRACYAPPQGLPVGRHTAAVSVQNPRSLTEPPRQMVAWAFDVTP